MRTSQTQPILWKASNPCLQMYLGIDSTDYRSDTIFESILNVNDEIIEDFENGNGSVYHPYIVEQFSNIENK